MGRRACAGEHPPGAAVRVRCLGPGPEHYFLSRDRARHRVCGKCAAALRELYVSPRLDRPSHSYENDGQESQKW